MSKYSPSISGFFISPKAPILTSNINVVLSDTFDCDKLLSSNNVLPLLFLRRSLIIGTFTFIFFLISSFKSLIVLFSFKFCIE